MELKEVLLKRRSIRKFKDTKIEVSMINDLIEAGYNAPSACNRKPLNFYVVTNEEKLALLNKSSKFSNMPSPLIIIDFIDVSLLCFCSSTTGSGSVGVCVEEVCVWLLE